MELTINDQLSRLNFGRISRFHADPVRQALLPTPRKKIFFTPPPLPPHRHSEKRKDKKNSQLFVGIAEGGARTRDLEVWNI